PKVIMADVSAGSLKKAEENCKEAYPEEQFDLRLGNGLEVLEPGEVDTIVIAGMGGVLMTEILGAELSKTKSFRKFILQPRSAVGELRHWLFHQGFSIIGECLVREGKFICEILTVVPEPEVVLDFSLAKEPAESIRWELPSWHKGQQDDLTRDYLNRKLLREEKILNAMNNSEIADPTPIEKNILYIKQLLED
ncbi:MAG: class I SAM-dependent methyltransferase, partial [Anaerovoracaceae bacterium]